MLLLNIRSKIEYSVQLLFHSKLNRTQYLLTILIRVDYFIPFCFLVDFHFPIYRGYRSNMTLVLNLLFEFFILCYNRRIDWVVGTLKIILHQFHGDSQNLNIPGLSEMKISIQRTIFVIECVTT